MHLSYFTVAFQIIVMEKKSSQACICMHVCVCVCLTVQWASSHRTVWKHVCLTVSWNSFWVKTNWCSCRRGWGQIMTTSARSTHAWTGQHHRPTPTHCHMDRRDEEKDKENKRASGGQMGSRKRAYKVILLQNNPSTRCKQVQSPVRCRERCTTRS